MKNLLKIFIVPLLALCVAAGCAGSKGAESAPQFVTVRDGEFYIGDSLYRFVGANFWYGAILGAEKYGDRDRLARELDYLKSIGITNLREKRDMNAVLYLNNAWEWSGGYGTYLEWTGHGKAPLPKDGYREYVEFVSQFVLDDSAKALALDHVRNIVGRTNTVTGKPYSQSPAIMSWQIANEPRAFSREGKRALADWLRATAAAIKEIDPNHLVSTGSEGKYGCEVDLDLWAEIHNYPEIDYANIHIWPYNWNWIDKSTPAGVVADVDSACKYTLAYIDEHYDRLGGAKPIVLEEFGYPRDSMAIAPGSPTTGRDRYYEYVFSIIRDSGKINGSNFWGWGGFASPAHRTWLPGDDYSGDPAQEDQGLNSVFAADSSTVAVITKMTNSLKR